MSTYGWRAYALPVLVAVTALIVYNAATGKMPWARTEAAAVPAGSPPVLSRGGSGVADGHSLNLPAGQLPAGGSFTVGGKGTWHVVAGGSQQFGQGAGQIFTYTVEVEDGVSTASYGGDESFATMVDHTLRNPKSWTKDPRFAFRRIDKGDPTFRVSLTSQMGTRQACGFDIQIDSSCYNRDIGRVVLDEARWVRGALPFQGDIGSYRQYLINHEVGHAIGFQQHQPCETNGGLAPVMMQQTFGTADNEIAKLDPEGVVPRDGKVCRFNPWPFPKG